MSDSHSNERGGDDRSHMRIPGKPVRNAPKVTDGRVTAGVPLTQIIRPRLTTAPEIVVHSQHSSSGAKRFRQLCATLDGLRPAPPQVIVVTSAGDGEGKSVVALNLALAFAAQRDGDVLLLEADLRHPTVGQRIQPLPMVGLAELLAGRTEMEHVLLDLVNVPLHVLPAGQAPADPVNLLASDALVEMMTDLTGRFRRIVIDTPPIVPYTDADLVASFAQGALLVARAGVTRRASLVQALGSVTSAPVLGVLLNDVAVGPSR